MELKTRFTMVRRLFYLVFISVVCQEPILCQLQQGQCKELTHASPDVITCNLPKVNLTSIRYEFRLDEQNDKMLKAFVSWDPPPQSGFGYDYFAVRLGKERFTNNIASLSLETGCDLDDLINFKTDNPHEIIRDGLSYSTSIDFGFSYWINIFTLNITLGRRTISAYDCVTIPAYDCYNITKDYEFCRNQTIQVVSAPVDPSVTCKTVSPNDNTLITGLFIEWYAPVQVAEDRQLNSFSIFMQQSIDNGNIPVASDARYLSEKEKMVYNTSSYLVPFSTLMVTRPALARDGVKNGDYILQIKPNVEPVPSNSPNTYELNINTFKLPTCDVEWAEWSACDCPEGNRTRVCDNQYQTGIMCDGRAIDIEYSTCACPLLSSLYIGVIVAGSAVLLALIIAVVWKCSSKPEEQEDETPETLIRDQDTLPGFDIKTPTVVSLPRSRFAEYEILRDDLGVYLDQLLGSGAQGSVYRGKLRRGKEWRDVAAKTPRFGDMTSSPENNASRESFFKEIEFSIDVQGKKGHPNILEVLGCCTLHEPYYLVTPFMKYGDLLGFLRKCQKLKDEIELEDPIYRLTEIGQLNILRQMAKGMEFLASLKYYMGDLAASNVLVGDHLHCKIADFGLGYDLYLTDGDINREQEAGFKFRPRWVSLETFESKGAKCNLKSDVWSFGVVMYEVATFGEVPYSQKWSNMFLLRQLQSGYRLDHPDNCSDELYNLMLKCWQQDPNQRPTFSELVKQLGIIIESKTPGGYIPMGVDLLLSDASGVSNIAVELDTVIERAEPEEENSRYIKHPRATKVDSSDYQVPMKTRAKNSGPPQEPSTAVNKRHETVQDTRRSMFNPHAQQNRLNTDGSVNSDFKQSFRSEEIDIKDFHSFERFPDNEPLANEKKNDYDTTL